jgi:hypothetical protein
MEYGGTAAHQAILDVLTSPFLGIDQRGHVLNAVGAGDQRFLQ